MKNATNKTAMQELITKLPFEFILNNSMILIDALKKEKEQIMNDFLNGKMNVYDTKSISAEQYFKETYIYNK